VIDLLTRRRMAGVVSTATLLMAIAVPASAHITVPDGLAIPAGSTTVIHFQVPHGCAGAPTDKLALKIPDGVQNVKPELMAGWTIDIVLAEVGASPSPAASTDSLASAAPIDDDAPEPQVSTVTWSGGSLPDDMFADFAIRATFPETPGQIQFPMVQYCGDTQEAWIETLAPGQDPESLEHPAPWVTVVAVAASPAP
jgi:uncharacterized protein YcnI